MRRWLFHHLRRVRRVLSYAKQAYLYRCSLLRAHSLTEKARILSQTLLRIFVNRKKILFYPDSPERLFVIYKIVLFLGYRITADPSKSCDIAIKWRTAHDGNPFLPPEPALAELAHARPRVKFLNMQCNDVRKERVSIVFEETFGYSLSVDPQTYTGKCVMKSNWNGLHVGHNELESASVERRDTLCISQIQAH